MVGEQQWAGKQTVSGLRWCEINVCKLEEQVAPWSESSLNCAFHIICSTWATTGFLCVFDLQSPYHPHKSKGSLLSQLLLFPRVVRFACLKPQLTVHFPLGLNLLVIWFWSLQSGRDWRKFIPGLSNHLLKKMQTLRTDSKGRIAIEGILQHLILNKPEHQCDLL